MFGSAIRSSVITWCPCKKGPVYVSMFKCISMVIAMIMGIMFLGDVLHLGIDKTTEFFQELDRLVGRDVPDKTSGFFKEIQRKDRNKSVSNCRSFKEIDLRPVIQDDVEPGVIFGRSFLRLTKAIVDFGNDILTIYPDLITFNFDSDDELDALLASINVYELPPLDISDFPPFVCNMGKNLRNKKKPSKTYKMSYDGEGPSLTINRLRTQKELTREEIEEDLYERIMILNERRPIIETLKYSDKHRTLLNGVLLDKLKLDGEFELEDEMVDADLIKGYKAIKEKEDPRVFMLPIRRDEVKPRSDNVRMLEHLSQRPWDVCSMSFTKYVYEERDNDDDEDYCLKLADSGKPIYGANRANNIFFGALPFPLKNTEWAPNYSGNNTKEDGDGKWHAKIRVMDPYGNVFEQGYETKETTREMSGRYKLSDIMSPNWL
ncbi:reverse transcriptase domain-containing protein [Tanacetum coccineum]